MALWCDPLDDLIEQLDRDLPGAQDMSIDDMPPVAHVQFAICPILCGTPQDQARANQDPRVQAVLAYYERLAREERDQHRQKTENDPSGPKSA